MFSDSKITIDALKEPLEEWQIEIRNCINDCKELFKHFDNITLQVIRRTKNKVAHLVAKSSFGKNSLELALGMMPSDIQSALDHDSTLCMNFQH